VARVLVVEDNPANMKLAVLLLEQAGHEVLQARDAEVGLQLARTQQPALIVMDVQLPGLSGLAATQQLKADNATAHIKVLALTALAMSGDEQRLRQAGCDAYLAKPLRYQQFQREIARLLEV
jgi:two-component system, cell cycle response regulator DivK